MERQRIGFRPQQKDSGIRVVLFYRFSFQGLVFQGAMVLLQKLPGPDLNVTMIAQARKNSSKSAEAGVVK